MSTIAMPHTIPTAARDAPALAEYRLTPHELVRVRRRSPELLEAEAEYQPGGKAPVAHRHPAQRERFLVQEGALRVILDGSERVLRSGEELVIEPGQVHAMACHGERPARVTWQTMPTLSTEAWWAAEHGGQPPLPAMARLLRRHADVFELAMPRIAGPLVALLARIPTRG